MEFDLAAPVPLVGGDSLPSTRRDTHGAHQLPARGRTVLTFDALYDTHARRVYGLALRMTCDETAADQITQDVFIRAWRSLDTYRGDSAVGTWLHRIAIRTSLDYLRSRRTDAARFALLDDEVLASSDTTRYTEARIDLDRALLALPEGARCVLVMHDIEGLKYTEIATELELAIGTVKSQLHRARQLLLEMLNP